MFVLLEILLVATLALVVARTVGPPWRGRLFNVFKAWVTVRAFWLLLTHPVKMEDGSQVVAGRLVLDTLANPVPVELDGDLQKPAVAAE